MNKKPFIIANIEIIETDYQSIVTASGAGGFDVVIDPESGEIWNGGSKND